MIHSQTHSSIIGLPTEKWVARMIEAAHLEGCIDPIDFVLFVRILHEIGKSVC